MWREDASSWTGHVPEGRARAGVDKRMTLVGARFVTAMRNATYEETRETDRRSEGKHYVTWRREEVPQKAQDKKPTYSEGRGRIDQTTRAGIYHGLDMRRDSSVSGALLCGRRLKHHRPERVIANHIEVLQQARQLVRHGATSHNNRARTTDIQLAPARPAAPVHSTAAQRRSAHDSVRACTPVHLRCLHHLAAGQH